MEEINKSSIRSQIQTLTTSSNSAHIHIDEEHRVVPGKPQHGGYYAAAGRSNSLSSILIRLHAGYFRITLSLGSQVLLWKTLIDLSSSSSNNFLQLPNFQTAFMALWSFSLAILFLLSVLYFLRCYFHLDNVKAEFCHHVAANYFFAPFASWLLLLQTSPFSFLSPKTKPYVILWLSFSVPIVALDVKIYGRWFTHGHGNKKKKDDQLSAVANPTCLVSVLANLVGARSAAQMGWKETASLLFSIGMVHYLVLLVTLYQRIPVVNDTSLQLPVVLRPVFFLFPAAPGAASLAWESIGGQFDTSSKMLFYFSIFVFLTLVCRPMLFKKSMDRFNVAWWAYSFPVNFLAVASAHYGEVVGGALPDTLTMVLSCVSMLLTFGLTALSLILVFSINGIMILPADDVDPVQYGSVS